MNVLNLYGGLLVAATALSMASSLKRRREGAAATQSRSWSADPPSLARSLPTPLERVGDENPYAESSKLPVWLGKRFTA